MEDFEHDELLNHERDDEHLPFIDDADPDEDYEDDIYDDIASFCSVTASYEDTSPRLAEEID